MFAVGFALTGCSDDDDGGGDRNAEDASDTSGSTDPNDPASSATSGEPSGDLAEHVLSAQDLPGTWETDGAEPLAGFAEGGTIGPICPDGDIATLADPEHTVGAPGNVIISFTTPETVDSYVTEVLISDADGAVFDALESVFESCVGEPFEQGADPVETVQYERISTSGLGDDSAGFLERWGTGGQLAGGEVGHVFVSTGDVVAVVSVGREGVTDPYDEELLMAAAEAAAGAAET